MLEGDSFNLKNKYLQSTKNEFRGVL